MKPLIRCVLLVGMIVLFPGAVSRSLAMEPMIIVADPWPPYTIERGEWLGGTDIEIVNAVFAKLEIPIQVQILPWARCLAMVKNKQADAILDISIDAEREKFLQFPVEPVSEGVTVFFVRKDSPLPFTELSSLNRFRAGAMLGYKYCQEIDESPFMIQAERVYKQEQLFNMLLRKRIDFLVEVDAVGFYVAGEMGISDQITTIPNANYCHGGNYLAFARKPGHEQLAHRFSEALRWFKTTEHYQQILNRYGAGFALRDRDRQANINPGLPTNTSQY
jgi:polar amino acid transport system substrate-binding protein